MSGKVADNPYRASGVVAAAAGGAISWCTSVKTTGFTAAAGSGYLVNTTSTAFTATLPTGPADGDQIAFVDFAGTFDSNALTLGRGGSKIKGACSCATVTADRGAVTIIYTGSTQGWIQTSQGNDGAMTQAEFVAATGGSPSTGATDGDYKVHTFPGTGPLCVSSAGNSLGSNTVDFLVIAGGGGGGRGEGANDQKGGGGGAGGYLASYPNPATGGHPVSASDYTITIGGGGTGGGPGTHTAGTSGGNSVFSTITSAGGGYGGQNSPEIFLGVAGGSGGGGSGGGPRAGGAGNTPPVSSPSNPVQGFAGGNGYADSPGYSGGGGGGGASAVGANGAASCGGNGGPGLTSCVTGSPVGRGGGGAGSAGGAGGTATDGGGGGAGCSPCTSAVAGTAITGGGGGAGGTQAGSGAGAAGGGGVVLIRYKFQ